MKPHPKLLRACGKGNEQACTIARKITAIYAGGIVSFAEASAFQDHPNKLPFRGTLLLVDEPSQKPPHGSQGHRILVRKNVAKSKLNTLPGMAVNYDPSDMDEHDTKHKVGIITKAWMDGNKVNVSGYTWKKDFPEVSEDLKQKNLGMSMELGDVYVANEHSNVWDLTDFVFTGATILKKDAAAYTNTSLSASRDKLSLAALKDREEGEKVMAKHEKDEKKRKVAAARASDHDQGNLALITQALTGSLQSALGPIVSEIKASNERVLEGFEEIKGLHLIQAAADNNDEDDDDEVVLHAKGHDDDDDDEEAEMEAAGRKPFGGGSNGSDPSASDGSASDSSQASDASDLEAMEDLELEDASEEPGEVNKDASNRGSKTTVTKPPKQGEHFKGNVAKGRLHSSGKEKNGMKKPFPGLEAAAVQLQTLHASNRKMRKTIKAMAEQAHVDRKKYKNQIKSMQASLEHFAELEGRRSAIPHELTNLAAKAGYNLGEIKANGQMLSVELVDNMFAVAKSQGIQIDPEQRMAMKMQLEEQGLLEDGKIERNYGGRLQ
jgi:hypothetical protein